MEMPLTESSLRDARQPAAQGKRSQYPTWPTDVQIKEWLAREVKSLRHNQGLTQFELADQVGRKRTNRTVERGGARRPNRNVVTRLEAGDHPTKAKRNQPFKVTLDLVVSLAKAFKMPPQEFLAPLFGTDRATFEADSNQALRNRLDREIEYGVEAFLHEVARSTAREIFDNVGQLAARGEPQDLEVVRTMISGLVAERERQRELQKRAEALKDTQPITGRRATARDLRRLSRQRPAIK